MLIMSLCGAGRLKTNSGCVRVLGCKLKGSRLTTKTPEKEMFQRVEQENSTLTLLTHGSVVFVGPDRFGEIKNMLGFGLG